MYVLGTAGHVDHGKSTLVKALTGIDPDRLKEEKEREMTTDLGFAWLTLPSGREVSVVDVPGHEQFIKNMLAGVSGFDLALLIVAADEGVQTQTREHLAILNLMQVKQSIVVLTKRDLVDSEWLDLVGAEVEDVLEDTRLAGSPIVPVSAMTGEGIPDLLGALDRLLDKAQPRKDLGRPRLPVDRSFTIAGFGTVVTGTLTDGVLRVGQEIELVPTGKRARIRGLQTHRQPMEEAQPGSRVAVNLSGISHEEIVRGQVLTTPGWLRPTRAADVHLQMIKDSPHPLRHNSVVSLHVGTAETLAKVRLLEAEALEPGQSAWAQLHLGDPQPLVKGDYLVLRSAEYTLGGGRVVDPIAKRHKRAHAPTLERLRVLDRGTESEVSLRALEEMSPVEYQALVQRVHLPEEDARQAVEQLIQESLALTIGQQPLARGALLVTAAWWAALQRKAQGLLAQHHQQHPLRRGISKEELRSRLGLSAQMFPLVFQHLVADGALAEDGVFVRLPDHQPRLSAEQQRVIQDYLRALEATPFSPPTDRALNPDLLNLLVEEAQVVKVSDDVVFAASAYKEMVERIRAHIQAQGKITVAEVRDLFGNSRKYALALMEHLDQKRVTRRLGDDRVLR
ncbi:MAG: selenocysteine-specific translation elongation factor [Dehalococcoidia bacterium]|nr:selenocysteine-specific translation elongation factor [Dehalococcoidia bacterium]